MTAGDLIEQFAHHLTEAGRTEATIEGYTKNLCRADRELPMGADIATADELRAWVYRKGLSWASRATYYAALDSFFTWAVDTKRLTFNPMKFITRPRVPETLPRVARDEQVHWAVHDTPDPLKLWALLASYAGTRCIEISRLCREHVTAEVLTVARGKGDRPRTVPTHPLVWAAVRVLPAGPITDLTPKQISTRFLQYSLRCGQRELSLHRLRGWHATNGYAVNNDLLAVSRNLGHRKTDTTARYIRLTTGQIRAVVDGLPTFGLAAG
jgi:integrase/recombinase XerC